MPRTSKLVTRSAFLRRRTIEDPPNGEASSNLMEFVLFTTGLVLLLAGCSISTDPGQEVSDGVPPSLTTLGLPFDCGDPAGVHSELPEGFSSVLGVVAFQSSSEPLQRGRSGPDNDLDSRRSFSKTGILVRQETAFQIHVAPSSQSNATISWGTPGDSGPVSSLAVDRCSASPADAWIAYPGGIWTLDSACTELLVLANNASATVSIPTGTECQPT